MNAIKIVIIVFLVVYSASVGVYLYLNRKQSETEKVQHELILVCSAGYESVTRFEVKVVTESGQYVAGKIYLQGYKFGDKIQIIGVEVD